MGKKYIIVTVLALAVASAAQAQMPDVLPSGLIVHLPTTDGKFEAELAAPGGAVVQGLSRTEQSARAVRDTIRTQGRYGPASILTVNDFSKLPYVNGIVSTLVVDADALGNAAPAEAELLRVLHPNGVLHIKKGNTWTKTMKPMPNTFGEWTHIYGGADNNMRTTDTSVGPPSGLRWISGPMCMDEGAVANGVRVGSGVMVHDTEVGVWAQEQRFVQSRNAFNGLPHFAVPMRVQTDKTRPIVVSGDKVFTFLAETTVKTDGTVEQNRKPSPLVALDKRSGKVLHTYENAEPFYSVERDRQRYAGTNFVVAADTIYQTARNQVLAINSATGEIKWRAEADGGFMFDFPSFDAERGLLLVAHGKYPRSTGRNAMMAARHVIAYDVKTGKERWRAALWETGVTDKDWLPDNGKVISQIAAVPDGIFVYRAGGISALKINQRDTQYLASLDPDSGKVLWAHEGFDSTDRNDPNNPRTFDVGSQKLEMTVMGGKIFLMSGGVATFDAKTGKKLDVYGFGNSRCDASHATANMLALGFGNFISLTTPEPQVVRSEIVRGHCATGVFPAYGMIYGTPNRCRCAVVLQGFMALAADEEPQLLDDSMRLTRGEAYKQAAGEARKDATNWPAFLSSNSRNSYSSATLATNLNLKSSFAVAEAVPAAESSLATEWRLSAVYPGPVSAPVIDNDKLYVAVPMEHRVEARSLDAPDKAAWSFTADARIDSPPTIVGALCVFGSRDGHVYCVDAASGQLRWKFLAAPNRQQITAYGGLESTWPVFGAVPVVSTPNGPIVVAFAGYHPETNGGIFAWGLHAATGEIVWKKTIDRKRSWRPAKPGKADEPAYAGGRASGGYNSNSIVNSLPVAAGQLVSIQGFVLDGASGRPSSDVKAAAGSGNPRKNIPAPGTLPDAVPERMPFRLEFNETSPERSSLYLTFRGPGHHNGTWTFSRRGEEGKEGFSEGVYHIAFSPDASKALLIPNAGWQGVGALSLYDTTKGRPTDKNNPPLFKVERNDKWSRVGVALTSNLAVVAERQYGNPLNDTQAKSRIELRDLSDGRILQTIDLPAPPIQNGLAVAGDSIFVTCTNGAVLRFAP